MKKIENSNKESENIITGYFKDDYKENSQLILNAIFTKIQRCFNSFEVDWKCDPIISGDDNMVQLKLDNVEIWLNDDVDVFLSNNGTSDDYNRFFFNEIKVSIYFQSELTIFYILLKGDYSLYAIPELKVKKTSLIKCVNLNSSMLLEEFLEFR